MSRLAGVPLLVGLALAACTAAAPVALSPPPLRPASPEAGPPLYSVGQRWMRSDGLYELTRVEGERYVFAAGPGREVRLTRDLLPARVGRGDQLVELEPPPRLTWPLAVGQHGQGTARWRSPEEPGGVTARVSWTVDRHEDVRVVAGTFKAFRITLGIESSRPDRRREVRLWYAPEIRQLVKAESPDVRLLAFEVLAVERPAPRSLAIAVEPADRARLATPETVVAGRVTGEAIARVIVTLNGREVVRQEAEPSRPEMAFTAPVTLRPGRNVVLVTATDAAGQSRQEARTLVFEPGDPRAAASASGQPPGPGAVQAAPLRFSLASPPDQARVEQGTVTLAGLVTAGKGVLGVAVSVNGVEARRLQESRPQPSLAVDVPVVLRPGANTLVVTAIEADGTVHQDVRTVYYEEAAPLTVSVRYPDEGVRLSEESTMVAAMVTSSRGVARVSVSVNGVEVHQQREAAAPKSLAVAVAVTLRPGTNAIVIAASEPDGAAQQEIRTVGYDRPRVPAAVAGRQPDRWAVVIGVGAYEHQAIPRLRYAVSDAEAIYEILTGPGGFKKEHVLLLTDTADRKPTLRNIRGALGTFLARSAKKEDTVLIFFAGHGAPEVDPRGTERDGLAKYLVPIDADPDDLFATALPMDDLNVIFARIEAERVVAFLDTCYSGAAGGRTFAPRWTRAGQVDDVFLERLGRAKGRAIVTAARPSEVSLELPELGHGLFTYYLLEGLKGAADLNGDGLVVLQELYEYVEREVTRRSRAVGGNQHPVMKGELEGTLPLVRVGAR